MPFTDINLDDRTFKDLETELRRRIPAYTPEWTDHNDSDPGIALIQLFAWLEEVLLYRLNKIPDKAYVKFLELVGIQLTPPSPAQADLTFKLASKDLPDAILIEQGTQVGLASATDGPPVIFETVDNLYAVGADLAAVQTFDGALFQVVTEFNRLDGSSYYAFGPLPQTNSALYLGFDRAFPAQSGYEYSLTINVDTSGGAGAVRGGSANTQGLTPPVIGIWEYWSGSQTGWKPVELVKDATNALTRTGAVVFKASAAAVADKLGALKRTDDKPLFWMRFRIAQVLGPGYESAPRITNVLVNTVGAINAVTENFELLGASNGLPNQTFQISHFPILPKSPSVAGIIQVDEGDGNGFQLWTQTSDFSGSDRSSKVYTLNYETGLVSFGDGEHGKIPHWLSADGSNREPADVPNIRTTTYRWGGGARGNAGANTITSLEKAIPFVDSVTNLLPSNLGADEETLDAAKKRAPLSLRTQGRAVTLDDFAFLATQTPGAHIARATALPLQRPQKQLLRSADGKVVPPTRLPGVVTVLVIPDSPADPSQPGLLENPKPVASDQTLAAVAKYLDQFRLVTAELYVDRPIYRQVEIEARVYVDPESNLGEVTDALNLALKKFYNPLTGGPKGGGWDFGGTIFVSDAYGQILKVDGVRTIAGNIKIYVDGLPQLPDTDIQLQAYEIVFSTKHSLDVSYPQ